MLMHLRIAVKDCLLICQSTISQPQLLVVNNNECSAWNITFWSHSNLFIYFTLLYFVFVLFVFYFLFCFGSVYLCFVFLFYFIIWSYYLLFTFVFLFCFCFAFEFLFLFYFCFVLFLCVYIFVLLLLFYIIYILYFFITKYIINFFLFIKILVFMLNMFKLAVTCWWRTYVVVNPITGHRRHIWYACTRMMHLVWPLMIKSPEMNLNTGATGP